MLPGEATDDRAVVEASLGLLRAQRLHCRDAGWSSPLLDQYFVTAIYLIARLLLDRNLVKCVLLCDGNLSYFEGVRYRTGP